MEKNRKAYKNIKHAIEHLKYGEEDFAKAKDFLARSMLQNRLAANILRTIAARELKRRRKTDRESNKKRGGE